MYLYAERVSGFHHAYNYDITIKLVREPKRTTQLECVPRSLNVRRKSFVSISKVERGLGTKMYKKLRDTTFLHVRQKQQDGCFETLRHNCCTPI